MAFYLVGCATVTVPVFEYNCLGKNRTCPAKQSSAFDFYCAACDPDHDNIEGVQTDTGSTEYVPVYPDGVGNLPVAISSTSLSSSSSSASSSSATAKPSAPSKTDREDSSDKKQEEASSTETQEKVAAPTTRETSALQQAKSYLSSAPISRAALIAAEDYYYVMTMTEQAGLGEAYKETADYVFSTFGLTTYDLI